MSRITRMRGRTQADEVQDDEVFSCVRGAGKAMDAYGVARSVGGGSAMAVGRALMRMKEQGRIVEVESGGSNVLATTFEAAKK